MKWKTFWIFKKNLNKFDKKFQVQKITFSISFQDQNFQQLSIQILHLFFTTICSQFFNNFNLFFVIKNFLPFYRKEFLSEIEISNNFLIQWKKQNFQLFSPKAKLMHIFTIRLFLLLSSLCSFPLGKRNILYMGNERQLLKGTFVNIKSENHVRPKHNRERSFERIFYFL